VQEVEFAWRVHAAQEQWALRADTKAAAVFTVEGAVIAAVVAALSNATLASSISGWRLLLVWLGTLSSTVAVVAAFLVVIPQIGRRRRLAREAHFIYFGHLRSWEAARLAQRLAALSDLDQIVQLSTQLTRVGVGNWRKYRLLRVAIIAALLGTLFLVLTFAWPR
jgi:hypothetical protein